MSDWKNPSFGGGNRGEWKPPISESNEARDAVMSIAVTIQVIVGFVLISTINALSVMAVVNLLGYDISYRNSLGIGALYVCWRAFDKTIFSRLSQ